MKIKPLVLLLAFSSLFFAILLPPEGYANGKLAVVLSGTFAFLSALAERRIPQKFLAAGAWIFGLLLLHTFIVSIDLYRSLDMLTSLWVYYCLIGFFIYCTAGYETHLAGSIVALSAIVSGYGLYQYFSGFDQVSQLTMYGASDQVFKAPALQGVGIPRISSTLTLPGTLWGFLVCAIPFHAMLLRRRLSLDILLGISAATLLVAGFLTHSFGFLLGLLVISIGVLWRRKGLLLWRATPVIMLLAALAVSFYSARHQTIESANPARLRLLNWVSGWNIFATHPMGTGLNTFGVIYAEYMQPNANETQFVHNTVLQLLSELGYPLIAALIIVLILGAREFKEAIPWKRRETFWLLIGIAAWIMHNMVDINVYFPSVGVVGAVLIGALFAQESNTFAVTKTSSALVTVFAVSVMAFSATACLSTELQHRADIEFENGKRTAALDTLDLARRISPLNSSLHHDAGDMSLNLYQATKDVKYLRESTEAFRTAVELSPEKAGSHIGYSLSLWNGNHAPEAIHEIQIAHRLYPSSSYIQSIARSMTQQTSSTAPRN